MSVQRIAQLGLGAFLRSHDADPPDGRPLHQYGASEEECAALRAYIHNWLREGYQRRPRVSAALVLVVSEWSFRKATRLHGFWNDAQDGLEIPFDEIPLYQHLAEGFRFWRRPVPGLARRRWITSLVREGGFPLKLSTAGFDGLIDDLLRRFSWEWLAGSDGDGDGPTTRVAQYLLESGRRQLAILDSRETAEFLADLVTSLARYRAELDRRDQLPKQAEGVSAWLAGLPPECHPSQHLPVRTLTQLDGLFRNLLFPQLERPSGASPMSVFIRWPTDDLEPTVTVKVPPEGLSADWVLGFFPDANRASRITLAPSQTLRFSFDLERDGAFFVSRTPTSWPLWATAGRDMCLVRRTLQGVSEFETGVCVPDPGPVAVFGPDGELVVGRTLGSATRYRLYFVDGPQDLEGPVTMRGLRHAEVEGAVGEVVRATVLGEEVDFVFVDRPLRLDVRGTRWQSGDRKGPYIGPPAVCVLDSGDVCARVNGGPERKLAGGPVDYRLPDIDDAGRVRLSLRAGPATGQAAFWMVPGDTRYAWGALETGGGRRLTVSSRGLLGIRVLDETGRELEHVCGREVVGLLLSACAEDRFYMLELCYQSTTVRAPLADIRRRFAINLGSDMIPLGRSGAPVRLERNVARLAALTGCGHPASRPIAIKVHSSNRGRRFEQWRKLPLMHTNEDGDFRLPLDGLIDELDNCARHEIILEALDDRVRWTFEIDDTHFHAEPSEGEPYGACLPGCQIRGVPTWRWVPAARQWERPMEAAMIGSAADGWAPPPMPPVPGGALAAPFDGSVRLAYVRYVAGPPVPDTEETLVRALSDRDGLTSRLLRQEFSRDQESRKRLTESLANLAFFSAGESLKMTRLARLDGAPLVYAAVRHAAHAITHLRDLRAVPLGAWLRVAEALVEDTLEWVPHLSALDVSELPIVTCALHHAGLPVPTSHMPAVNAVAALAEDLPVYWFGVNGTGSVEGYGERERNLARPSHISAPRRRVPVGASRFSS